MPNPWCFYCGKGIAPSGKPTGVEKMSSGHGPPTDEEIITLGPRLSSYPDGDAPHASLCKDETRAHMKCYRWMVDVNKLAANRVRHRRLGLDNRLPVLTHSRQSTSAVDKAASLEREASQFATTPVPGGPSTDALSIEEVNASARAASSSSMHAAMSSFTICGAMAIETEGQRLSPLPTCAGEAARAAPSYASANAPASVASTNAPTADGMPPVVIPRGKRKGLINPSRRLETLKGQTLLRIARQRVNERRDALRELARVNRKCEAKSSTVRGLRDALTATQDKVKLMMREMAKSSMRLEVFDEAAELLGAADLSDIPTRFAEAVVSGHIDPVSIFARFMDDQMFNVFHATQFTHRFKPDVHQWLGFCLTHPSPGRVFDTLAGNTNVRSQMGLILPSLRTW